MARTVGTRTRSRRPPAACAAGHDEALATYRGWFAARDRHPQPLTAAGRKGTTQPRGRRTQKDSAPTREKRHFGGEGGRPRPPLSGAGQAREAGATRSRAAHPSGNACGSAIDRANLRPSRACGRSCPGRDGPRRAPSPCRGRASRPSAIPATMQSSTQRVRYRSKKPMPPAMATATSPAPEPSGQMKRRKVGATRFERATSTSRT